MELIEFIHFHLGCEVIGQYNGESRKGFLTGIKNGGYDLEIQFFEDDGINVFEEPEYNRIDDVKLLLRPLTDLNKDEAIKLGELLLTVNGERCRAYRTEKDQWRIQFGNVKGQAWIIDGTIFNQRQTMYLLKQNFNLFDEDWKYCIVKQQNKTNGIQS
jgi:hypothetical protein